MCIDPVLDLLIKKYYTVFVCSAPQDSALDRQWRYWPLLQYDTHASADSL